MPWSSKTLHLRSDGPWKLKINGWFRCTSSWNRPSLRGHSLVFGGVPQHLNNCYGRKFPPSLPRIQPQVEKMDLWTKGLQEQVHTTNLANSPWMASWLVVEFQPTPSEKYANVKLDHVPRVFRVKIKNIHRWQEVKSPCRLWLTVYKKSTNALGPRGLGRSRWFGSLESGAP